ncbi:MAG: 50S ribosomal protein L11 methyltransferase [Chloroflexota bacterium]|nr:MAG: 50S ribosomal protein L11 methyltransferase [Chloroflexota bacterium]
MSAWLEVSLQVDGEAAEATAEVLQRYGYQGVAIEQEGIMPDAWSDDELPPPQKLIIRAYLPVDDELETKKANLEAALGYMNLMYPMPQPVYRQVAEEDWAEAWKAHYHPVRLGRRLLVRPLWIDVETGPDDIVVALDPGMAFGTGTHPTTHLCLEALEDLTQPGAQVLDLGCGSGILAIAAAKLGAAHVLAVDNDPIAVRTTIENAAQNGVSDRITAQEGSLDTVLGSARRFDLVAANLIAKIILNMSEQGLGEIVRPGGVAVFSGIIQEQVAEIEAALRKCGLEPYRQRAMGDWVAIEARRPHA